jgi:hypothetical protein
VLQSTAYALVQYNLNLPAANLLCCLQQRFYCCTARFSSCRLLSTQSMHCGTVAAAVTTWLLPSIAAAARRSSTLPGSYLARCRHALGYLKLLPELGGRDHGVAVMLLAELHRLRAF